MKIDRDFEVLAVPEAVGHFLNRLNLGIEPFAHRICDQVLKVRQNLGQIFPEHPRLLDHRLQPRMRRPEKLGFKMSRRGGRACKNVSNWQLSRWRHFRSGACSYNGTDAPHSGQAQRNPSAWAAQTSTLCSIISTLTLSTVQGLSKSKR